MRFQGIGIFDVTALQSNYLIELLMLNFNLYIKHFLFAAQKHLQELLN